MNSQNTKQVEDLESIYDHMKNEYEGLEQMISQLKKGETVSKVNEKLIALVKQIRQNVDSLMRKISGEVTLIKFKNLINLNAVSEINFLHQSCIDHIGKLLNLQIKQINDNQTVQNTAHNIKVSKYQNKPKTTIRSCSPMAGLKREQSFSGLDRKDSKRWVNKDSYVGIKMNEKTLVFPEEINVTSGIPFTIEDRQLITELLRVVKNQENIIAEQKGTLNMFQQKMFSLEDQFKSFEVENIKKSQNQLKTSFDFQYTHQKMISNYNSNTHHEIDLNTLIDSYNKSLNMEKQFNNELKVNMNYNNKINLNALNHATNYKDESLNHIILLSENKNGNDVSFDNKKQSIIKTELAPVNKMNTSGESEINRNLDEIEKMINLNQNKDAIQGQSANSGQWEEVAIKNKVWSDVEDTIKTELSKSQNRQSVSDLWNSQYKRVLKN